MNQTMFKEIKAATEVDLNSHAVIEASAGTGKTFTLIEMVVRLLIEQRMQIEQILLVTFTEQATGEIKSRIRSRLREELNNDQHDVSTLEHIEINLAQLNQAPIFTIHGFCQGALKEFAFEQGGVFEAEVIQDKEIYPAILRQMKRKWPSNTRLIRQLKAFVKNKKLSSIDHLLIDLAGKFKPEFDVIYPSADQLDQSTWLNDIHNHNFPDLSALEQQVLQLKGSSVPTLKKRWQDVIKPLLSDLIVLAKQQDAAQLNQFFSQFKTEKSTESVLEKLIFSRLNKVYSEVAKNNERAHNLVASAELFALIDQVNEWIKQYTLWAEGNQYRAIEGLLKELIQLSQKHKNDQGLISYDDMIIKLWQQLLLEKSLTTPEQLLTTALRNKYQVAIIDEFQDTDIRQWQIFEQLFLKAADSTHRLWVIGDPKQAIYGFRGADLHTYESAKQAIFNHNAGRGYRLSTNYRTVPGLIDSFNRFYADDTGGWFEADSVHVSAADESTIDMNKTPQIIDNKYSLKPLNCLTVEDSDIKQNNKAADYKSIDYKSMLAKKIALTIKQQIINQVEVKLKGQQRFLNESDVCVLVRSNSDAEFIEAALREQNIPFTFHKKKKLYQSIEAIHVQVLLTALAQPNDIKRVNNALLSLFFGLKATELKDFADEKLPGITALWLKVKEAVVVKDWISVFDLLLNDSGALLRARKNSRRSANIQQMSQELIKFALQNNASAQALLKEFQHKRDEQSSDEGLHHKDTERAAVRIMTMHISKGLEFPVVFLFGGFGLNHANSYLQYYAEVQQGMVFDLIKHHRDIYQTQQTKEAQQLYYVAMTRAIFMLFLPYIEEDEIGDYSKQGWYVQTVMQRLKESGLSEQTMPALDTATVQNASNSGQLKIPEFNLKLPVDLYPRRRNLHSFSSLSRLKSQVNSINHAVGNDFDHSLTAELMQAEPQSQLSNQISRDTKTQQAPQIPGGVKTGHVLHGIFEHVDFTRIMQHVSAKSVYQDDTIMQVIDEQMKLFKLENRDFEPVANQPIDETSTDLPNDYRQQLADWTWHTLNKPLDALNGLKLAKVPTAERSHELSFFWNHDETYLTGFIDLFFAVQDGDFNDYYILDWKSNFSANGYTPEVLASEVMAHHQYNWQYQLYAMAMQQWFDALGLKNARLKGAIYLFSRGINCNEAAQNGVFFDDFTQKNQQQNWQIDDIRAELLKIDAHGFGRGKLS